MTRTWTATVNGAEYDCRSWDKDEDRSLRRYWAAGLACRAIGRKLGRSHSSVISRAHKLGLPARPAPIVCGATRPQPPPLPSVPASPAPEPPAPTRTPEVALPPAVPQSSLEVRPAALSPAVAPLFRTCQYPRGDRPNWDFCGAPVVAPSEPYCAEHRRICWQVLPRRMVAA